MDAVSAMLLPPEVETAIAHMGNRAQADILRHLAKVGPSTTGELIDDVDLTSLSLNRHLAALGEARIVCTSPPAGSRHGKAVTYLWRHLEGGTSGDIGRSIGTGYKTVLWHLRQLESLGAIDSDGGEHRIGQRVIYRINMCAFEEATADFLKYLKGK